MDRVTKILKLLKRQRVWWADEYEYDEDDDDATLDLEEGAAYVVELARVLPERAQVLHALVKKGCLANLGPIVGIASDDDVQAVALAVAIVVAIVKQGSARKADDELLRDLAAFFPLLAAARGDEPWTEGVRADLTTAMESADAEDEDDGYDVHPGQDTVKFALRLLRTKDLGTTTYALKRTIEAMTEWVGPVGIERAIAEQVRRVVTDVPPVSRVHAERELAALDELEVPEGEDDDARDPDAGDVPDLEQDLESRGVVLPSEFEIEAVESTDFWTDPTKDDG